MNLSQLVRSLYRYRAQLGWVLLGVLLPTLTNLVSEWLELSWGPLRALFLALALVAAVGVVYFTLDRVGKFRPEIVPRSKQAPRFPGLIQLVGPGQRGRNPLEGPNVAAMDWHLRPDGEGSPLRVCWLIASEQGTPVAEMLRERYKDRCRVEIRQVWEHLNPYSTYEVVQRIYEQEAAEQGLAPEEIVADFTGGHKVMTAGMILACGDRWPMEYVSGGPEVGAQSIPILIRFQKPA